jgi:beta-mannosidase
MMTDPGGTDVAALWLSSLEWTLSGWRPFAWKLGKTAPEPNPLCPDILPVPVRFPMSVQQALLEAGVIPDWNKGMNSLLCEWVEHRHWEYSSRLRLSPSEYGDKVFLDVPGLDYSGWILIDGEEVVRFSSTTSAHRIDLGSALLDGTEHELSIIFEEPPREQGQMGYTSRSRFFKSRYNYGWDWCPRIVPIGPWLDACIPDRLESRKPDFYVSARLEEDFRHGTVEVRLMLPDAAEERSFRLSLSDGTALLGEKSFCLKRGGAQKIQLTRLPVEAWWPNGFSGQKRYTLTIEEIDGSGTVLWAGHRRAGFKHIDWLPCEGAPDGADPWLCCVNGAPIFLQGANWVPPRAVYHDAQREHYATLIRLYKDMGVNLLRVWGGGILEKEVFYDLCDEAGILVWQEMPLSSSGIENCPPEDSEAIQTLQKIASNYVRLRGHHVSLLLWSGGNELTWGSPDNPFGERPVDMRHPAIHALKVHLEQLDPGRRFVATSPTGPQFYAHPENYGKGLHHDIHGPWGLSRFERADFGDSLDVWKQYWAEDDSLFRSEAGMPGAASLECLEQFAPLGESWPFSEGYWRHTASWWTQERLYRAVVQDGIDTAARYVAVTQDAQAQAYAIAAKACKSRFPQCGGFVVWMGHDCFPCPANNSLIDYLCTPKAAYKSLQAIFLAPPGA